MLEATGTLSGLGFSPLNYVEMWSAASQARSSSNLASAGSRTTAASTSGASSAWAGTGSTPSASLFASSDEIDLQVELSIARLKAAAQQALRNRAAQLAAGGSAVRGGGSYAYSIGPDGQLYATGVTLSYDTAPVVDDPQATIAKMQQVRAAALASSSPTASDYAAAATATQVEMQARLELVQQMAEQYLGSTPAASPGSLLSAIA